MFAARKVLRAISPHQVLTASPTLKLKVYSNQRCSPAALKEVSDCGSKNVGSNYYLNLEDTSSRCSGSEPRTLPHDNQTCSVFPQVSVHVSESSPMNKNDVACALPTYLGISDINKMPLSPSMFDCCSPLRVSPRHQRKSPSGFLYTPDRKDSCLGRGSFGNVTLCKYKNYRFALKIIHHNQSSVIGEKNLVSVRHINLVSILKVVESTDKVLVFMEFAGHSNLQQLLDKVDLDFTRRLGFSEQLSAGLNHCHQLNIAHGDVKPLNVIVSPKGVCKLGDFGLSVKINYESQQHSPSKAASFAGTAAYAAPEVLRGMLPSLEADIYSLGVTLWQIYTGKTPFAGEHPHIIIYKVVSRNVRPVLEKSDDVLANEYLNLSAKCWDKNPAKRPTSEDVLKNLERQFSTSKKGKKNDIKFKILTSS